MVIEARQLNTATPIDCKTGFDTVFKQIKLHRKIADDLFPQICGHHNYRPFFRRPYEDTATIAVLSMLFADGDSFRLAEVSDTITLSDGVAGLISHTARRLVTNESFLYEIFNGDARYLIISELRRNEHWYKNDICLLPGSGSSSIKEVTQ